MYVAHFSKGPWGGRGRVQAEGKWGTEGTYVYFGSEVESFGVLGLRLGWPVQKWGFRKLCGGLIYRALKEKALRWGKTITRVVWGIYIGKLYLPTTLCAVI